MKKYSVSLLAAAGLLVGCNQSVQNASDKFNELPPAVQKTARAQDPNAQIVDFLTPPLTVIRLMKSSSVARTANRKS